MSCAENSRRADVLSAYERWAPTYDETPNPTRDLDAEVLRKTMVGRLGGRILELGCGTGKNTSWLARQAEHLIALDFSQAMMQRAKKRVGVKVEFHVGDICARWPVTSNSLDAVVGNLVLEHIEDLAPIYEEAQRTLLRGGYAFFSEFHPFRQYAGKGARYSADGCETSIPAHVHHLSDFIGAGLKNGFELVGCDEWFTARDEKEGKAPRLLTLLWRKK